MTNTEIVKEALSDEDRDFNIDSFFGDKYRVMFLRKFFDASKSRKRWVSDGIRICSKSELVAAGVGAGRFKDAVESATKEALSFLMDKHHSILADTEAGEILARLEETIDGKAPDYYGSNLLVRGQQRKHLKAKLRKLNHGQ